jgi:two-component sensor histidine kinase
MKKTILILFVFSLFSVFSQEKAQDSISPDFTVIKTEKEFQNATDYFENYIKFKRSEHQFSSSYLKLAESYFKWCEVNEPQKQIIRAKYYLFHYYNNQLQIQETIKRGEELLTNDAFLNMRESVFVLYVLKLAYNNAERYDELLKLLQLYQMQTRIHGSAFSKDNSDAVYNADNGFNHNYAHVYYNLKNYKQAQRYFKMHLNYLLSKKSFYGASSCYNNIGLSFFNNQELDSALVNYNKALELLETKVIGENLDVSATYLQHFKNSIKANIANIYEEHDKFDIALPYHFKVLKTSKITNEAHLEIKAYYDIASIYYYKKQPEVALKYLDSVFEILKYYKSTKVKTNALNLKAKLYLLKGESDMANVYFKEERYFKDSVELAKVNKKYLLTAIKLNTEDKLNQLIKSKAELSEKRQTNFYQKLSIGFLILLIAALFLISKRNRKKSKIISAQKQIVTKSLNEKEVLLREVHHRVKNNLQLISGLLHLQSNKYKNEVVNTVVNESQKHINSIALIHEMLYQDDDVAFINMQNYVDELTDRLSQVSHLDNIKFHIDTNKVSLPLNYATTIGLMLNELITNSFKYAFKNNEGIITVLMLKTDTEELEFVYKDNGVGMVSISKQEQSKTLGLRLIKMLAEEIDAQLKTETNDGLIYTFKFKIKEEYV